MVGRRRVLQVGAALGAGWLVGGAGTAWAQPEDDRPTPDGPWVQENQPIQLNGLLSNEQLYAELDKLARQGRVGLEEVGRSVVGRPLHLARVGSGPRKLLVVTQQHGDEPLGTEAAVQLLRAAGADNPAGRALREGLTLLVMPRVNPDGWERYQSRDFASGLDPRRNENNLDLNRFYGPARPTSPGLVPEAFAVNEVVRAEAPDLVLDYHHQVSYQTAEGELVTMSVLWATALPDEVPQVADGKRAAVVMDEALARNGHSTLTLYPRSTTATVARNGLATDGYATLLVEQRGQQDVGQKGSGALVREALLTMEAVAGRMAADTFAAVDPALADLIQERGTRVRAREEEEH